MTPSSSDLHVNGPLTNISLAMMQRDDQFISDDVFPVVSVAKQSDLYYVYDRNDWNRVSMRKRAPATESAGSGFKVSRTPYYAEVFALHKDIDDQTRANAGPLFNLDRDAAAWLGLQAKLSREVSWATDFFKTGVWTTDITGVAAAPGAGQVLQWNDAASTPIEDIRAGMTLMQSTTGIRPNTLTLGQQVWDKLADHVDLVDRIKSGGTNSAPAIVMRQALASILELDRVLVLTAIQNTANEGATTQTNAFIAGKKALLSYAPPAPGLLQPSSGYTFAWTGYLGGTQPVATSRLRIPEIKVDRIEIEAAYDQKLIAAELGYFFNLIVA